MRLVFFQYLPSLLVLGNLARAFALRWDVWQALTVSLLPITMWSQSSLFYAEPQYSYLLNEKDGMPVCNRFILSVVPNLGHMDSPRKLSARVV